MKLRSISLVLAALVGSACSPVITYQRSGVQSFPPKPATCDLEILSLPPQRAFVEIGTFDIENAADNEITTSQRLVEELRPQACQAGADAIFAQSNGEGEYVKATAIRYAAQTSADEDEEEDEPAVKP